MAAWACITGYAHVDGPTHDMSDDEIATVDRVVVRISGDTLGPRGESPQRRVAREI
ncbi:MAG: hypothetical protein M3401_04385 [Actinomycetota bacterium]|nr:hypothetical protein [Actinomycetota bacterium]